MKRNMTKKSPSKKSAAKKSGATKKGIGHSAVSLTSKRGSGGFKEHVAGVGHSIRLSPARMIKRIDIVKRDNDDVTLRVHDS